MRAVLGWDRDRWVGSGTSGDEATLFSTAFNILKPINPYSLLQLIKFVIRIILDL